MKDLKYDLIVTADFDVGTSRILKRPLKFLGLSGDKISASEAVHEVKIIVNERGTEAEAATAMKSLKSFVRRTKSFVANKPFLFAIHHKSAGVLFVGKYVKPEEESRSKTENY